MKNVYSNPKTNGSLFQNDGSRNLPNPCAGKVPQEMTQRHSRPSHIYLTVRGILRTTVPIGKPNHSLGRFREMPYLQSNDPIHKKPCENQTKMVKSPKKGVRFISSAEPQVINHQIDISKSSPRAGDTYVFTIVHAPHQVVEVRTAVVPSEPLPAEIALDSEDLRTALLLDLHNCPDAKVLTSIVVRLAMEKRLMLINAYSAIFLKKLLPLCPLIDLTPNQFRTLQRHIKDSLNII